MEEPAQLTEEDGVWVVRVQNATGKVQEYRCASEQQARQLCSVLVTKDKESR